MTTPVGDWFADRDRERTHAMDGADGSPGCWSWHPGCAYLAGRAEAQRELDAETYESAEACRADGAELIAAERHRQVESEGWTPEHDASEHDPGDLARAARAYLTNAILHLSRPDLAAKGDGLSMWPFERSGFKPGPTPLRTLVKAGALIEAEIDRLMAQGRAESRDATRGDARTGNASGDDGRGPENRPEGCEGCGADLCLPDFAGGSVVLRCDIPPAEHPGLNHHDPAYGAWWQPCDLPDHGHRES